MEDTEWGGGGLGVSHQPPPLPQKSGSRLPSPLLPQYIFQCLLSFSSDSGTADARAYA